jgi:translocation and assembly module TamB
VNVIKKILKYGGIGTSVLLLFLIILTGISQTRWFKNQVLQYVVKTANENLQGQISAEVLEGNLFNHLDISNIYLLSENDTIVFLPKLSVDFSLINLFRKRIIADSILFSSPRLYVKQLQEGGWNINGLFKGHNSADETIIKKEHEQFGYKINLKHVALRNAEIHISSPNSPLPEYFHDLNAEFSGYFGSELQELHLIDLNFSVDKPEFYLEKISFNLQRKGQLISLQNVILQTRRNELTAEGHYQKSSGSAALQTEPLEFKEFEIFLPEINLPGNPTIILNTSLYDDSVNAEINFTSKDHSVHLNGWFTGLQEILKYNSYAQVRYGLEVEFNEIRLTEWLNAFSPDITLNGLLHLQGKGLNAKDAMVKLKADFVNSQYLHHRISKLTVDTDYLGGNLNGKVDLLTDFGELKMAMDLWDILSQQKYLLDINASGLNLEGLIPQAKKQSNFNFEITARGEGFNFSHLNSDINLRALSSSFDGFRIDSLKANAKITGSDIHIQELYLASASLKVLLNGQLSPVAENNFQLNLTSGNIADLSTLISIDSLQGSGSLSAHVQGKLDSLISEGQLFLTNINYQGNSLESLDAELVFRGNIHRFSGFMNMSMNHVNTPAITMDQVTVKSDFNRDSAEIALDIITQPDLEANLVSRVKVDSVVTVAIPFVSLRFRNQQWNGGTPQMKIIYTDKTWQIDNFVLNSSTGKSATQKIQANGIIRKKGREDFHLSVEGLDLKDWGYSIRLPVDLSGVMNLNTIIKGTAGSPIIKSTVSLDSGSINQIHLHGFRGSANYQNRQLSLDFSALPTKKDSLILEGFLPLNLSLAELPDTLIPLESPLNINLKTNGFPLSIFDFFKGKKQRLNGNFECKLAISGTPSQPLPKGTFKIGNAFYIDPNYGIDIQNIEAVISLSPQVIVLERFRAERDKGKVTAFGKIDINRDEQKFSLQNLQLDLQVNQFYLSRHKNQEIQLDGNLNLRGNLKNLKFIGDITIPRASIYLPAFLNMGIYQSNGSNEGLPLLVQEQERLQMKNDSLTIDMQHIRAPKSLLDTLNIFKNLNGTLRIHTTRNTWLKQPNTAVELSYDLVILKKEEKPEITGKVEILRGYYNLLGRRFNLKDSYVYFEDGRELIPRLDIQVEYTFRTSDRQKKTLKIYVRGNTDQPIILFSLDDKEIEESVAFSYIIYGRSPEELSAGEQSDLNSTTNIMASYLSNQLGSTVGNMIGVDELEINSEDNWQSASVRVGKYLSPDLYVSYEQRFGEDREGDIIKKLVTLEYEISRNILLQLVGGNDSYTGFDFIFKFDRE